MKSSSATEASPDSPDAHGQAALFLVESLIHGLVARSALSVAEAISITEIALDAQMATIEDAGEPTPAMRQASALLSSLIASLRIDLTE